MKRSIFYQVGSIETPEFDTLVEEVLLAEQLAIDTVWCFPNAAEGGNFRDGAPSIWLSALASRTERIRLGWGLPGMTPPNSPPLRMAEQAAVIDLASGGRLELALMPEGELDADDAGAWDEGVRMLIEMWDTPSFSWTSPRFTVQPVDVVPKPVQQPHPPLWLAGWSAVHARRAGERGLAFLDLSGATDETLVLHRDEYAKARAGADPNDLVSTGVYGIGVDLEASPAAVDRLLHWEALGFDHVIVRAAAQGAGDDEAGALIRFLAGAESRGDERELV